MKKQDESKNKFRCMVCNEWRLRGVFVTVKKGSYAKQGYVVKTCQSQDCIDKAKVGNFGAAE